MDAVTTTYVHNDNYYVVCRSCTDAELHHNHSKIDINKYICTGLSMCREKASATVHTECPITSTKIQNSNRISFTSKEAADFWYVFAVYIIFFL